MCNRPGTENDNEWRNDQQNNTFSFLFRLRDFSHRLTKDIIQGFCYWRNHIQSESRPTRDVVKLNATLACKCLSPGRIPFAVSELNGDALLTSFSYAVNIAQAVGQGLFGPAMCERSNVKARERGKYVLRVVVQSSCCSANRCNQRSLQWEAAEVVQIFAHYVLWN